jgi:hypothetical protein
VFILNVLPLMWFIKCHPLPPLPSLLPFLFSKHLFYTTFRSPYDNYQFPNNNFSWWFGPFIQLTGSYSMGIGGESSTKVNQTEREANYPPPTSAEPKIERSNNLNPPPQICLKWHAQRRLYFTLHWVSSLHFYHNQLCNAKRLQIAPTFM